MKTKSMQHFNPIWKDEANFIIGVTLNYSLPDYEGVWEQLWSKKLSDYRFLICCIPFFAKDLSLGDEVETDEDYMIQKVIKPSGFVTFRVWFGDSQDANIRIDLYKELELKECLLEWYSDNLLAVSCPEHMAQNIANNLYDKETKGLFHYETGKS